MTQGFALVGAPLLALAQQSLLFWAVQPACTGGQAPLLGLIAAACTAACARATAVAWPGRHTFTGLTALGVGALATLASVSMAVPVLVLSPCTG